MPYPTINAGQRLTAGMLQGMQWQSVTQGSDQVVNNSATLVNTSLIVPAVAGATYMFRLLGTYSSNTTPDIQFDWTVPASGAVSRWGIGTGLNNVTSTAINSTDALISRYVSNSTTTKPGGISTSQIQAYFEHGTMEGGNGGNITFRFAQNTANASDTTFYASSRLEYLRIG